MQRYGDQGSGVVPTAWALLSLMDAKCSDRAAVERGVIHTSVASYAHKGLMIGVIGRILDASAASRR